MGKGTAAISRQYDALFAHYADKLPVPFLRALAYSESRLNPNETKGGFWGILQVGWKKGSVLPGYNKRFDTQYTKKDLLNPSINTQVASELVNRIARLYGQFARDNPGPLTKNLVPNFASPEFVKLLVAGWNSGYSRAAGVLYMARWLVGQGIPVTQDNVFMYAEKARASKWLRETSPNSHVAMMATRKKKWQAGVQRRYFGMDDFRGGGVDVTPSDDTPIRPRGGGGALVAVLLLPLGLLALSGKG